MKLPSIPSSLFFLLFSSSIIVGVIAPPPEYGLEPDDAIPKTMTKKDIAEGYDIAMWITQWFFCPNCVTLCDDPKAPAIGKRALVEMVKKTLRKKPKDLPKERCPEFCTGALKPVLIQQVSDWTEMLRKGLVNDPRRDDLREMRYDAKMKTSGYQCTGDDLKFLINHPNASPLFNGKPDYESKAQAVKTLRPQRSTPAARNGQVPGTNSGGGGNGDGNGSGGGGRRTDGSQNEGLMRSTDENHRDGGQKRRGSSSFPGSNNLFSPAGSWRNAFHSPLEMRVPSQGDVGRWVSGGAQGVRNAWTHYQEKAGPALGALAGAMVGGGVAGRGGGIKVPGSTVPLRVIAP